jgi:hypothetical protein
MKHHKMISAMLAAAIGLTSASAAAAPPWRESGTRERSALRNSTTTTTTSSANSATTGRSADTGEYPYGGTWHGGFMKPYWGQPVPLVVPPISNYQTIWSWAVGGTQVVPIFPQYAGPGYFPFGQTTDQFLPTPYWPNDTRQFGVYYIRGPW